MATSSDRASRLRQALQATWDDYQHQLEILLPLRQLIKGSVYDLQTRCGKLHSSAVISWSEHGKTRLRTLPPDERARCRQLTDDYRSFRTARAALVKLHRRMLDHIDRLERVLRLPPPQPASRRRKK